MPGIAIIGGESVISAGGGIFTTVICWNGEGTPDVTKIPAGVVVTYNDVEYTGTMAASQETTGKVYAVCSDVEQMLYDMYLTIATTSQGVAVFIWNKFGDIGVFVQGTVRYDMTQNLTPLQRICARGNIDAAEASEVSTTLPETLADNVEYRLGSKSSLTLALPASGDYGIVVNFTASAAFTPTITGTTAGAPIPTTVSGKKYRLFFDWDGAAWVVSYITYS